MAKKRLAKGWKEGTVGEFLQLSPEEEAIVEMRVRLSRAVREKREELGMSQRDLAKKMGTAQPHISEIENGAAALETMIRAYLVLGGKRNRIGKLMGVAS